MIVNNSEIINGLSVTSLEIENNSIKLIFKNGASFILTPDINEDNSISYQLEYLTGKDNKQIKKLQQKIQLLESEVQRIVELGVSNNNLEVTENLSSEENNLE